jgi:hypothetical protein
MKILDTNAARNNTTSHGRIRLVLALAGILIAILSSLALVQDIRTAERFDVKVSSPFETAKIVAPGLSNVDLRLTIVDCRLLVSGQFL